jgi:hypothetical protein
MCARHRLLPWRTITVQTRDLRYGAEAVARHFAGAPVGFVLHESQLWPTRQARRSRGAHSQRTPIVPDDLFVSWAD